jgi:hypothetical protein
LLGAIEGIKKPTVNKFKRALADVRGKEGGDDCLMQKAHRA